MVSLSPKQHCLASWTLAFLLLLLLFLVLVLPWYSQMSQLDESIEQAKERVVLFESKLKERPKLEASLQDQNYEKELRAFYLKGETVALAGAELQRLVKLSLEETNGELVSTQMLNSVASQSIVPKVRVKVRMRGDTSDFLSIVHSLESKKPLLFVEDISVRNVKSRRKGLKGASNTGFKESLDISLTLSGFIYKRQAG